MWHKVFDMFAECDFFACDRDFLHVTQVHAINPIVVYTRNERMSPQFRCQVVLPLCIPVSSNGVVGGYASLLPDMCSNSEFKEVGKHYSDPAVYLQNDRTNK